MYCQNCGHELEPYLPFKEWLETLGVDLESPHTPTHIVSHQTLAEPMVAHVGES